jgi:hypothetical protein
MVSKFAFKFNLYRYIAVEMAEADKQLSVEECTMIPKKYPIQGCVTSKITKAPLTGATVKLLAGGAKGAEMTNATTDEVGLYKLNPDA